MAAYAFSLAVWRTPTGFHHCVSMGEANCNKMKEMQEQTPPLRQAGTTAQMAEAALFFLTSASNITGEFLIVDAGMHLASLPMKAR